MGCGPTRGSLRGAWCSESDTRWTCSRLARSSACCARHVVSPRRRWGGHRQTFRSVVRDVPGSPAFCAGQSTFALLRTGFPTPTGQGIGIMVGRTLGNHPCGSTAQPVPRWRVCRRLAPRRRTTATMEWLCRPGPQLLPAVAFLNAVAGLNPGTVVAAIWMTSPDCGLRPWRAEPSRGSKVPRPGTTEAKVRGRGDR